MWWIYSKGAGALPLADWLRLHPGITTLSRDRAPAYQEGATSGAPQAQQVADRWHILKNLTTAWEQYLHQQASVIKAHWPQVYAADDYGKRIWLSRNFDEKVSEPE